jgi:putative iron-regulated protein
MKKIISALFLIAISVTACKKAKKVEETPVDQNLIKKEILESVSNNVVIACYTDMSSNADNLYTSLYNFQQNPTQANQNLAQQAWRDTRNAWEQSEGFLFGPVSTDNIDPRIDSWPINYASIDSILSTSNVLTAGYVNDLEDALKGFHPIEYILWGANSNKTAAQFTAREIEFLVALGYNLKTLCAEVKNAWDPLGAVNYSNQFVNAGSGSISYSTQKQAYEEMINAMIAICDEVGNGKINEPFELQDPSLEESPYADNSLTDFTNNMRSVQNVYLGKYLADGKGLEDLIKSNFLSMDTQLKTKINTAISSLQNISGSFGTAISTQPTAVQNSVNAINDLKSYLELSVLPFVQTLVQ